jgi:hypothetical protein
VTTVFSFSFRAELIAEIKVATIVGQVVTPISTADYTVTINPNGVGGNVTFLVAPANLLKLYIYRETEKTQLVSVSSQTSYNPQVVEDVWDRLTFQLQELADKVTQAARAAPGEDPTVLIASVLAAAAVVQAGNVAIAPNGTLASPGYAFVNEVNTGFLRPSAGLLQTSLLGVLALELSATYFKTLVPLLQTLGVITAGTNAQGQAPLTNDFNVITVAAAAPSGVTLPTGVVGRRVTVVNRGANDVNIYPASGGTIGQQLVNLPLLLLAGQSMELLARTTTQWELSGAAPVAGRNRIINGQGRVNQRGYVSGTATGAANQYTLDRWRVVTSGQSLTFTGTDAGRVMTAPAGGCEQVIEGANIEGGTYVINWTGTATCQVDGVTRAKGATFTLTANTNSTIRMIGGTFTDVQVELGSTATPFERLPLSDETMRCQRYYYTDDTGPGTIYLEASAGSNRFLRRMTLPVTMRTNPAASSTTPSYSNCSGLFVAAVAARSWLERVSVTATGPYYANTYTVSFDAEF